MPGNYCNGQVNELIPSIQLICVLGRDNVEWDEEQEKYALSQVERHASSPVPEELRGKGLHNGDLATSFSIL